MRRPFIVGVIIVLIAVLGFGIFYPSALSSLTEVPRRMLGLEPIVYPYYFIYDEASDRHLATVSIVVTVDDELITEDDRLFRIVRIKENRAYARYVRDLELTEADPR